MWTIKQPWCVLFKGQFRKLLVEYHHITASSVGYGLLPEQGRRVNLRMLQKYREGSSLWTSWVNISRVSCPTLERTFQVSFSWELQDFLCHTPFHSVNGHMTNKTVFFFVCTYTNRAMKESRLHVLYLYPYLYLGILWQWAISRYFSVKIATSAPNEDSSYLNFLPSVELYLWYLCFHWVSGRKGSSWVSSCNFFLMRAVCRLPFCTWRALCISEPWLQAGFPGGAEPCLILCFSQLQDLLISFWHKQK